MAIALVIIMVGAAAYLYQQQEGPPTFATSYGLGQPGTKPGELGNEFRELPPSLLLSLVELHALLSLPRLPANLLGSGLNDELLQSSSRWRPIWESQLSTSTPSSGSCSRRSRSRSVSGIFLILMSCPSRISTLYFR